MINTATNMVPVIDRDKCTGCEICVDVCSGKCIHLDSEEIATIEADFCENCGICASEHPLLCPEEAIKLPWDTWQKK